jgi:hypothetical protein
VPEGAFEGVLKGVADDEVQCKGRVLSVNLGGDDAGVSFMLYSMMKGPTIRGCG